MKQKKYDVLVYIGRFQPLHNGHTKVIDYALQKCRKLIVVLGSANSPRTIKNPFTQVERKEIIYDYLFESHNESYEDVLVCDVEDSLYSNADWITRVFNTVNEAIGKFKFKDPSVGLIGVKKDADTATYIDFFGSWDFVDAPLFEASEGKSIDSTKIRELYLSGHLEFVKSVVPKTAYDFLHKFQKTQEYVELKHEYDSAIAYEHQFDSFPSNYGLNFLTVDAVVVQSGHVLLVERARAPGRGLWALPGGHVNPSETFDEAVIRELREETEIKVPEKVLRGSIKYSKIFDHPSRSLRGRLLRKNGRTVTNAYLIKLDDNNPLPRIKGCDDAKNARFFTFSEVKNMRDKLFEDHYSIIEHMLARV